VPQAPNFNNDSNCRLVPIRLSIFKGVVINTIILPSPSSIIN
jgi:hypothetical protein